MSYMLIYITFSNKEEAEKVAKKLIEDRLIACANIFNGVLSFFWWKGKIEKEREVSMIAKTKESLFKAVLQRVKELHSYECPCVIALPITDGNPEFLKWIDEETGNDQ